MKQFPITVVIPAYKKTQQLCDNLRHNLPYLHGCEIIVVNDNPNTSIQQEIKEFPGVILIENSTNLGFAGAVNVGIVEAHNEYIFLMNSDVLLKNNSFTKALKHFETNKKLFAVAFAQEEKNGSIVGRNSIRWENGMFMHSGEDSSKSGETAWAEGGSSIFDKQKLISLGAFDTIYSPFYWEDIDVSYRALKQGYTVYFDADILVEHHHESTIGSYFKQNYITSIAFRNQLFFTWKNITDGDLFRQHMTKIVPLIIRYMIKGDWAMVSGFFKALKRVGEVTDKRQSGKKTDTEILNSFQKYYRNI